MEMSGVTLSGLSNLDVQLRDQETLEQLPEICQAERH